MQTDVLIVGGGLAGLACALGLADSGLHVTLLEQSAVLGGRARSWIDPTTGDAVDIGPHILLSEYRNMLALLDRLGTRRHIRWDTEKFITLVDRHRPIDMRMHRLPPPLHFLPSFVTRAPVPLRDTHSNRRVTWFAMKMTEQEALRLDAVNAAEFLQRMGVTRRFRDWFWASACISILNVPLEECSAGALMRFFRIMLGYNDLRMGFPTVGLSELYVPQARRRIEAAGGTVLLDSTVREFTATESACTGARLADGREIRARYCVSVVPPQCLRELVPAPWRKSHAMFQNLEAFRPSPYISAYLWFDRKLTHAQNWARVWSPDNLNYDFYDLSNLRDGWQGRASVIASNIIYSHRANGMDDDAIVAATVQEIADLLPEAKRANVVHARVHRIPMAIPCPYPGTERKRAQCRSPIPGLFLAGDWTRTHLPACMESAVFSGWRAAEEVLRDAGAPRRLTLPMREAQGLTGLVGRWRAWTSPARRAPSGIRQPP